MFCIAKRLRGEIVGGSLVETAPYEFSHFAIDRREEVEEIVIDLSLKEGSEEYKKIRSDVIFGLFNAGIFRSIDEQQRQALIDSFLFLPNRYLSADGYFYVDYPSAIDKFPSLMSVRKEKLLSDGNRIVPSAMIRNGTYVGKSNIFMFHAAVNLGVYIGDGNLIDSHASLGSAAQIGNENKIGSFVSLEGVLSPANARPVVIGSKNFLGSFVRVGTGIVLGDGNFIGSGVNISLGTKLKDLRSGGEYVSVSELGPLNNLCLLPNNAKRTIDNIEVLPGEYLLMENKEDFRARFEGDSRIRGS